MMRLKHFAVGTHRGWMIAMMGALTVGLATLTEQSIAADSAKPTATAQPSAMRVSAELIILHATNDGTGIDQAVGKMPELSKPPFSSYNSYKLLEKVQLVLEPEKSTTTKLPNERMMMVTLKSVIAPEKKNPRKFVINASIQKPDGKTFLPLLEVTAKAGENFFVAGQTYKGGILVVGLKIVSDSSK